MKKDPESSRILERSSLEEPVIEKHYQHSDSVLKFRVMSEPEQRQMPAIHWHSVNDLCQLNVRSSYIDQNIFKDVDHTRIQILEFWRVYLEPSNYLHHTD